MRQILIRLLILVLAAIGTQFAKAQDTSHVLWGYAIRPIGTNLWQIDIIANIDSGYYIYSQIVPESYSHSELSTDMLVDFSSKQGRVIGSVAESGEGIQRGDLIIYKNKFTLSLKVKTIVDTAIFKWMIRWTECRSDGKYVRKEKHFKAPIIREKFQE